MSLSDVTGELVDATLRLSAETMVIREAVAFLFAQELRRQDNPNELLKLFSETITGKISEVEKNRARPAGEPMRVELDSFVAAVQHLLDG